MRVGVLTDATREHDAKVDDLAVLRNVAEDTGVFAFDHNALREGDGVLLTVKGAVHARKRRADGNEVVLDLDVVFKGEGQLVEVVALVDVGGVLLQVFVGRNGALQEADVVNGAAFLPRRVEAVVLERGAPTRAVEVILGVPIVAERIIPVTVVPIGSGPFRRAGVRIGVGISEVILVAVAVDGDHARGDDHQAVEAALVVAFAAVVEGDLAFVEFVVGLTVVADSPAVGGHVAYEVLGQIAEGTSRADRAKQRSVLIQNNYDVVVLTAEGVRRKSTGVDGADCVFRIILTDLAIHAQDEVFDPRIRADPTKQARVTRFDDHVVHEGDGMTVAVEAADEVALDKAFVARARADHHFAADREVNAARQVIRRDHDIRAEFVDDAAVISAQTHVFGDLQELLHRVDILVDKHAKHILACNFVAAVEVAHAHRPTIDVGSVVRDGYHLGFVGGGVVDESVEDRAALGGVKQDVAVGCVDGDFERALLKRIGLKLVVLSIHNAHHAEGPAHAVGVVEGVKRRAFFSAHRIHDGRVFLNDEPAVVDGVRIGYRAVVVELARPTDDAAGGSASLRGVNDGIRMHADDHALQSAVEERHRNAGIERVVVAKLDTRAYLDRQILN